MFGASHTRGGKRIGVSPQSHSHSRYVSVVVCQGLIWNVAVDIQCHQIFCEILIAGVPAERKPALVATHRSLSHLSLKARTVSVVLLPCSCCRQNQSWRLEKEITNGLHHSCFQSKSRHQQDAPCSTLSCKVRLGTF